MTLKVPHVPPRGGNREVRGYDKVVHYLDTMDTIIAISGISHENIVQGKDPGNHENGVHGAQNSFYTHCRIALIPAGVAMPSRSSGSITTHY